MGSTDSTHAGGPGVSCTLKVRADGCKLELCGFCSGEP